MGSSESKEKKKEKEDRIYNTREERKLWKAARDGHTQILADLLAKGVSPNGNMVKRKSEREVSIDIRFRSKFVITACVNI